MLSGERGSSPLARGTRDPAFDAGRGPRLIPARAGNTFLNSFTSQKTQAHPRSRGEHWVEDDDENIYRGSSPLARGTRVPPYSETQTYRLIPARAGNTTGGRKPRCYWAAHPRSRGEHPAPIARQALSLGSSPLARGTHVQAGAVASVVRLIPARAGNTSLFSQISVAAAAHPRSRGEHCEALRLSPSDIGSSPLARGTLVRGRVWRRHGRLIPARAGNTRRVCAWTARRSAHPRSRGEHLMRRLNFSSSSGSSPLARGTR